MCRVNLVGCAWLYVHEEEQLTTAQYDSSSVVTYTAQYGRWFKATPDDI